MTKLTKKEQLLDILDEMIKTYENLPEHAKSSSVTHYDHISLLLLMKEFFVCKETTCDE